MDQEASRVIQSRVGAQVEAEVPHQEVTQDILNRPGALVVRHLLEEEDLSTQKLQVMAAILVLKTPTVTSHQGMEQGLEPAFLMVLASMEEMDSARKLLVLVSELASWEEQLLVQRELLLPWECITDICSTGC